MHARPAHRLEADLYFRGCPDGPQAGSVNLIQRSCEPAPAIWRVDRGMFRGVLGDCRLPGSGLVLPSDAGGDAPAVADRDALGFRPRPDAAAALASCCGARRRVTLSSSGLTGMLDERREPL